MGWEQRERGTSYYTRSRRVDGRVRREYIGGGIVGQVAARLDEYECLRKEETAAYWKEQQDNLQRDLAFLLELEKMAEILTRAQLLAAGCHKHKGEWRRARGEKEGA